MCLQRVQLGTKGAKMLLPSSLHILIAQQALDGTSLAEGIHAALSSPSFPR